MNDITFFYLLSLSIIFAAILGVIRFREIDPAYHPFIYYACLAVIIETIVYILLLHDMQYIIGYVYNFFTLAEICLLTKMFYNWGLFKRNKKILVAIVACSFVFFAATLYIRGYSKINYFSRIVNSFALIFFSISAFNKMIVNERNNIFKNAKFWICIGMIIFFTYFILVSTEQLSFLNIKRSEDFEKRVWLINAWSNVFINLLYAVAVIWMPRKKTIITLL